MILLAFTKDVDDEVRNKYQCHIDDYEHDTCVMLVSMSHELQMQHKNIDAHTIIMHIKELFYVISRAERYETFKELFHCNMTESLSVNTCFFL